MGCRLGEIFDEHRIRSVATTVGEALECAAVGAEPWELALQLLNAEFPNCYVALANQDFLHDRMNHAVCWNLDPSLMVSYSQYYAHINPYQLRWMTLKSGGILSSEVDFPVRNINNTEFYNDWLLKADACTAGIGLKLDVSPTETIYLPVQIPEKYIDRYAWGCTEVLRRLRAPLERSIRLSTMMRQVGAGMAARAALADRYQGPALVLDPTMHILHANDSAVALFREASFAQSRNGKLLFWDAHLTERIGRCLTEIASSVLYPAFRLGWESTDRKWMLSLTRLHSERGYFLVAPKAQILLQMVDLTGRDHSPDLTEFARLFRLTPAEIKLVAGLADGLTLADTALRLGITFETARQRLKNVFQKTGTSKQPELTAMLARYPG